MKLIEALSTDGGHIAVGLFIFLVGVLMLSAQMDYGKEVIAGSLASLWTALKLTPPTK